MNYETPSLWVNLTSFSFFDEFINVCLTINADKLDQELMFQDYEGFSSQWYSESGFSEKFMTPQWLARECNVPRVSWPSIRCGRSPGYSGQSLRKKTVFSV